jgi:hypothetical protein
VSIGAAAATGDWLLFTDADTYHFPGSTRRALADAVDHDAVLVSYSPEQEMETFWERALIPVVFTRLAAHFSFARVNDPKSAVVAANGQFLLVLRDAYAAVGGHKAVAGDVLEDVALARRVKSAGYGIYFTAPIGVIRTRMYRSFRSMWQGWTKNLYPLMGGSVGSLLRELALATPLPIIFSVPLLCYWVARSGWQLPVLYMLLFAILAHARYALELYKNLLGISLIQYYVPGVCLYTAALIASWWKNTRGSVVWKGRAYPARDTARTKGEQQAAPLR